MLKSVIKIFELFFYFFYLINFWKNVDNKNMRREKTSFPYYIEIFFSHLFNYLHIIINNLKHLVFFNFYSVKTHLFHSNHYLFQ